MAREEKIPFTIGDEVEEKSFSPGFRGAWFRGKLLKTEFLDNKALCEVEYLDCDGKKNLQLYQHPEGVPASGWKDIMLRPKYPATKMVRKWREGDAADYLRSNAHWSGKIIKVVDDNMAKFECPSPPYGEGGGVYVVPFQNLRPALNWSLRDGWQVPTSSPAEIIGHEYDELCLAALREWDACFNQAEQHCAWNYEHKH